jgi:hypothetical protein
MLQNPAEYCKPNPPPGAFFFPPHLFRVKPPTGRIFHLFPFKRDADHFQKSCGSKYIFMPMKINFHADQNKFSWA